MYRNVLKRTKAVIVPHQENMSSLVVRRVVCTVLVLTGRFFSVHKHGQREMFESLVYMSRLVGVFRQGMVEIQ